MTCVTSAEWTLWPRSAAETRAVLARRVIRWAAVPLVSWGCAGAGGSTQTVPDSVPAGKPAAVELHLSVTGSGARIAKQFSDVALFYRLVGSTPFRRAPEPRRVPVDTRHETYAFTIPPHPVGTSGLIEMYFTAALNGQLTRIPGMKQIRIE